MKRSYRVILVTMLIVFSFVTGFTYRDFGAGGDTRGFLTSVGMLPAALTSAIAVSLQDADVELSPVETYWNVYAYLDSNYYEFDKKPETEKEIPRARALTYAALRGMLSSLGDRYTRFLDPKEYTEMQQENRGDFEGIGAELDVKDGRVFIRKPIESPKPSPAKKAGLKSGDIILKVDDQLIQGMDIVDVVKLIRGDRGTKVTLTIKRENIPEPFDVSIVRDVVPFSIVDARMEDEESKIGYIELKQFNEQTDVQFEKALDKLCGDGMRGLILDLRRNPGGLLDVAVEVGSRFIKRGDIVVIQNRGGFINRLTAQRSKYNHAIGPLVVLIDDGSASASEIIAGAVRDHKVGTLIGSDTFGKGLVQTVINLEDQSAISITTAKYLTPGGHDVNKEKIHPDIVVEPTDEDLKNNKDVQLAKALQVLRERLGASRASSQNRAQEKS